MEDFPLVKDFAIIMVTAGGIAFLSSRLRLSPVFGYLMAGILIGPYTFSNPPIENVDEIQLLADLGLVLLLFGIGLEFNWKRISQIGFTVVLVAVAEILTMLYLGYWLGQLLGWDRWDSIFLGSALCISSSSIAIATLKGSNRLDRTSSRLIIGISVAEDFAAIVIIAILTGMARTGVGDLDFSEAGYIVLKLVAFVAGAVAVGTLLVPRIIKLITRSGSREVLLITSLGLCFGGALISRELGLSVAAGAFLMGTLLGNIDQSEEITEIISPIHLMFGALYFVAIGMLVDISRAHDFIGPALVITAFFIGGKILGNTLLIFLAGFKPKTSLEVGTGMPHMGEFSLAIAKIGNQHHAVRPVLYPAIAISSAITALISPFLTRSTDSAAMFMERRSPALLKGYILRLSEWGQELHLISSFKGESSKAVRRFLRIIVINLLIVMAIVGIGTVLLPYVEDMRTFSDISDNLIGFMFSLGLLTLCLPSFWAIWHSIRTLDDVVTTQLVGKHLPGIAPRHEVIRIVVRDSIFIVLLVFATVWSFPLISKLFALGSLAIAAPAILLAVMIFLTLRFVRQIHSKLEQTLSQTMLGKEEDTTYQQPHPITNISHRSILRLVRVPKILLKLPKFKKQRKSNNENKDNREDRI